MERAKETFISRNSSLRTPTECRVTQKQLTFQRVQFSSIAAASKNSYLVTKDRVGYQLFENGKLVINRKHKQRYSDGIYLKSQKTYFMYILGLGIFKLKRGSTKLKFWFDLSDESPWSRSLSTNEQENILIFLAYDKITAIPITLDGSPGKQLDWSLQKTRNATFWGIRAPKNHMINHQLYGEKGDRIALVTKRSKHLILLKINPGENILEENRYALPSIRDGGDEFPSCLAICPLKQILAVALDDPNGQPLDNPHGLVIYKLQGDVAIMITTLAFSDFSCAMTMIGYRGDDLFISRISCTNTASSGTIETFKYNSVKSTLEEIECLKTTVPVRNCRKMVKIGNTLLVAGNKNTLLSIKFVK